MQFTRCYSFLMILPASLSLASSSLLPVVTELCSTAWVSYNGYLASMPLETKACTSALGFLIGDAAAQLHQQRAVTLREKKDTQAEKNKINRAPSSVALDISRILKMTSFGLIFHGTICHFLFNIYEKVSPGTDLISVLSKIALDQVVVCPPFSALFLLYTSAWDGVRTSSSIATMLKSKLPIAVLTSWKVWPLAHLITFFLVPLSMRVLFINFIQIFYSIFLSQLASNDTGSNAE